MGNTSNSSRLTKQKAEKQKRNDPLIQKLLENQAIQFGTNSRFDYNKYLREGEIPKQATALPNCGPGERRDLDYSYDHH